MASRGRARSQGAAAWGPMPSAPARGNDNIETQMGSLSVDESDTNSDTSLHCHTSGESTIGSNDNMSIVSDSSTVASTAEPTPTVSSPAGPSRPAPAAFGGDNNKGALGTAQPVVTNYFKINKIPNFRLKGYRVDFEPAEDDTKLKRSLMSLHKPTLGNFMFDGHMLYVGSEISPEHEHLRSVNPANRQEFDIRIRKVTEVDSTDRLCMQFYNIVMRNMLEKIGLEQIGRHYYDRSKAIPFKNDHLELWPGFVTAIREHEDGILLCCEVTHKVLRRETAFDIMADVGQREAAKHRSEQDINQEVKKQLQESIVLTHYNRRTYRVDNIDFDLSPKSQFKKEDGTMTSYADYYKTKWNITLAGSDLNQPLLVSYPRRKDINKGIKDPIYLVPSLCNMTGLTDAMRKNFDLMKRLSVHLHMNPQERKKKLDEFIREFTNPAVQAELDNWNVQFDTEFVRAEARIFPREKVQLTDPTKKQPEWLVPDKSADWTIHFRNAGMLEPVSLKKWIVYMPSNESDPLVKELIQAMQRNGSKLGTLMSEELAIVRYDSRPKFDQADFLNGLRQYRDGLQLVFYILPNNALPRYAAVKRACTLELKAVSQCFLSKNLKNRNLNSVCQKMLIQMNAKMCGEPWSVSIPPKKLMVLGFDVYHCPDRKGESVGALVSTVNRNCTKYFSTATFHKDKMELSQNLQKDIIKSLEAYLNKNQSLPVQIILFRDGVGEGQIEHVINFEVTQVERGIRDFYRLHGQAEADVKLAFIIVTKKINTRYLVQEQSGKWISPIPGTVLDTSVTLPERFDFFLVSQTVRQGTVSPVNYHVVHNTSGLNADRLQQLAYKLCHLYFNWSGTVAVPAPCQYAHKLAYITGMALANCAPSELAHNLWYL